MPARSSTSIFVRTRCPTSRSPCSATDVRAEFFLHVIPEDLEDLPADRRQYGFGGANFHYGNTAALAFGGRCIMEHPLPDYPIARIRTGQFTPEGDQIWMAEVPRRRGGRRTAAVYCCPIVLRKPGPYMETICVKRQHACEHRDARRSGPPATGLESTVGVYGYLCLYLKVLFFIALCAAAPRTFQALGREDYWVEYLTAAWFLLAVSCCSSRPWRSWRFRRCAYILGGMALMFVAGERNQLGAAYLRVCDARFTDALE